jgi:hypothetical protein
MQNRTRITFDDMSEGAKVALILNSFMSLLLTITALFLLYVLIITFKKHGKTEIVIPSMLLNLLLSSISMLIFFTFEINECFYT